LRQVIVGFAGVPYENASELVVLHARGREPRLPAQMIEDHLEMGTGATCYALTAALAELPRLYGFEPCLHLGRAGDARPDRKFVPNHVALSVTLAEGTYLCDPGMVLHEPLSIGGSGEVVAHHGAREVTILTQLHDPCIVSELVESATGFRQIGFVDLSPITEDTFMASWRASFDPLLPAEFLFMNQFDGESLWTLSDRFLTRRDRRGHTRTVVDLVQIAGRWGLPQDLVRRAWHHTPHSRGSARVRATLRRSLSSILEVAHRRIDFFP
jgi:arylamine N-acetyltransferase